MFMVMNTAVTRNDWVGRVIDGKFPLLEWLANTEQAGVFRTELKTPQPRPAVIRLVPAQTEHAQALLQNWQQAGALSHPHLAGIISSGRAQVGGVDLLYVVTEYADESLAQVIPERPLSTGEAREMLGPIIDALTYLHGRGLVHGGVKPSNIMVVGDRVKLPVESVRRAGANSGPREKLKIYDAPEVASGKTLPASDVWSLGITLVEALVQTPPRWDRSLRRDPVVPSEIQQPFAAIARACLRYDSDKRATLRDLKALLNPAPSLEEPANEIDQLAPAEIPANAGTPGERAGFNPRLAAIIGGVLVLLAVIVFALVRPHSSRPATSAPPSPAPQAARPQPPSPVAQVPPHDSVSARGEVAERVMPAVAASANRTIHGKVDETIRVDVDAEGRVAKARIEGHSPSRYFGSKALDAARKWRFKPARQDGKAVPSAWRLRFQFRRSGPEANAAQIQP
jgi:TonB family protein